MKLVTHNNSMYGCPLTTTDVVYMGDKTTPFVWAHEIYHVKMRHAYNRKDRSGQERFAEEIDATLWAYARQRRKPSVCKPQGVGLCSIVKIIQCYAHTHLGVDITLAEAKDFWCQALIKAGLDKAKNLC